MSIESVTTPHWENIFDNPPIEFNDTEEYEYTEYLEAQTGGGIVGPNQNIFRLYNRDVDPYLYFHKGFIRLRGFLRIDNNAADDNVNAYGDNAATTRNAALCNLAQFKMFTKAELKVENTIIQKVDNPGHVVLCNMLTKFCDDNLRSQGTFNFFYKDTGFRQNTNDYAVQPGAGSILKYLNVSSLALPVRAAGGVPANFADANALYDHIRTAGRYTVGITVPDSLENPAYNEGHYKRVKICQNQTAQAKKYVELNIPLAYLFDFYDSCRFPFRGQKHEITLYLDANKNNYILKSPNHDSGNPQTFEAADHKFVLEKISMWIPRLKPSLTRMAELDAKLASGATQLLAWKDYDFYQSPLITAPTYNWRVTAMQSRPSKMYIFFQKSIRSDGGQTFNKMVFDTLPLQTLEVRVNGHIFPNDTLKLDLGYDANLINTGDTSDYMRAYLMLLESQNKMLVDDTGMLISYEEFRTIYNLYVFDLTKMERRVYESISASEIEIRWTGQKFKQIAVGNGAGQTQENGISAGYAGDYYCYTILESDKRATLQGSNNKMLITL